MKITDIRNGGRKNRSCWGFTLIELVVVMAILGVLVLIATPKLFGYTQKAKNTQIKHNVKVLEKEIDEYLLSHENFPEDWEQISSTEMDSHLIERELFDINGVAKVMEDGEYYKTPDDFVISANLPVTQSYLVSEHGKVYAVVESVNSNDVETKTEPVIPVEPVVIVVPPAPVGLNPLTEGYIFDISTKTITGYSGSRTDIIIPKTFLIDGQTYDVLKIGANAFINKGLTKLVLSNNLVSIGNEAFKGNPFTDGIILDADLTTTGSKWNGIFEGVALGDRVQITENVTKIPAHMFIDSGITNIKLPNSITRIEALAFCGAQLKSISLSGFVTFIGDEAFYGNPFSEGVIFGANLASSVSAYYPIFNNTSLKDGLTITTTSTMIQANTFKNAGITKVSIPAHITEIGNSAFQNNQLTNVDISTNVTKIGNSAFENNKLTKFLIPTSVTSLGERMLAKNSFEEFVIPQHVTIIPKGFLIENSFKKLTIPSHVTRVGDEAFGYNPSLESVILDSNLTYAGSSGWPMFHNSSLKNGLTITTRVASIPAYAFKNAGLNSAIIPASVTSIGTAAFENNLLTVFNIPSSVVSLGERMLAKNRFEEFIIPEHITSIPKGFLIENIFKRLTIPSQVTIVGEEAFGYNPFIESIILDANLTYAGSSYWPMFLNSSLKNGLTITSRVTSIPAYAFNSAGLTSVSIPTSVTAIGRAAFENNKLTEFIIPTSVISLGERMLAKNKFVGFSIPEHLTTIPKGFLIENTLTNLTIPKNITSVGEEAFGYNPTLSTITLDANLTYAGSSNFPMFLSSPIKNGLTVTPNATTIPPYAFKSAGLTSVRIPSSVTSIGQYAFENNRIPQGDAVIENLSINITLGAGAFNGNTSTGAAPIIPVYQN